MDNFLFAINAVIPLFLVVAVGYFVRAIRLVDDHFLEMANQFCFKVALPCLLFKNIYTPGAALGEFDPGLMVLPVVGTLAAALLAWVLAPWMVRERAQAGVVVQGTFRSNFVLFGLPLVVNVFGPEAATPTSIVMAVVVPLFNVLSVIALTTLGPQDGPLANQSRPDALKGILWSILKNPFIIAVVIAVVFSVVRLPLPGVVTRVISDLGQIATPLMLVVLGGQFKFQKVTANRKPLMVTTLNKLVVVPGVMIVAAVLVGYRGAQLAPVFGVFATPTAIASLVMANSMGGDGDLAGQIILVTTLFSVVTIVGFVYALRVLGVA